MKVHAVCDHGIVRLPASLARRLGRVEVVVEIPDVALDNPDVSGAAETGWTEGVGEELDAILGPYRKHNRPVSPDEDKQAWHEHLFRKHLK